MITSQQYMHICFYLSVVIFLQLHSCFLLYDITVSPANTYLYSENYIEISACMYRASNGFPLLFLLPIYR